MFVSGMKVTKKLLKTLCEKEKMLIMSNFSFSHNAGFSPEIFEGVVAFSGVVKLGSITNVTQSATLLQIV